MNTNFNKSDTQSLVEFHGHTCLGLAIGIRVSEFCLDKLGHNRDSDLVCVCETDMCAVDAIQFLTGCTLGKGNLVLKDHGKPTFSFYNRDTGDSFRAVFRPGAYGMEGEEFRRLQTKLSGGKATDGERREFYRLRHSVYEKMLGKDLEELFDIGPVQAPAPRGAAILKSIVCDQCGEQVMESRIRLFQSRNLCLTCFSEVEQKI